MAPTMEATTAKMADCLPIIKDARICSDVSRRCHSCSANLHCGSSVWNLLCHSASALSGILESSRRSSVLNSSACFAFGVFASTPSGMTGTLLSSNIHVKSPDDQKLRHSGPGMSTGRFDRKSIPRRFERLKAVFALCLGFCPTCLSCCRNFRTARRTHFASGLLQRLRG